MGGEAVWQAAARCQDRAGRQVDSTNDSTTRMTTTTQIIRIVFDIADLPPLRLMLHTFSGRQNRVAGFATTRVSPRLSWAIPANQRGSLPRNTTSTGPIPCRRQRVAPKEQG